MDVNPYKSPESEQETQTPPPKPPSRHCGRYITAGVLAIMAFGGLYVILCFLGELTSVHSLVGEWLNLSIACLVGLLIAWSRFRASESEWPSCVASVLAVTGATLALIVTLLSLRQ